MSEHDSPQTEPAEDGYYEIDPEGPDASDLARAAEADAAEGVQFDAEQAAGDAAPTEQDVLARVQQERDELEQKLLRVSADYQNFARRAQQNITAAGEQKLMDVARGLVTVLDHFDRALEAASGADADTQGDLHRGVTMVHQELLATLGRFGIERVDVTVGEPFDPVRHEALMRQPAEGVDSNHVTMQMQPGYVIGEKVVRPAQVGVAE